MTASDVLTMLAQIVRDVLTPDMWRIVVLLLGAWAVLLLAQIRRLLRQLVEEGPGRSSMPERDEPPSLDDLISRH